MNLLALELHEYNPKRFYYLESKKNIVIPGIFTKFIYTESYFTMNEVFFDFPIQYTYIDYPQDGEQYTVYFDRTLVQNVALLEKLNKLETEILYHYALFTNCRKVSARTLVNRLYQGFFKVRKPTDGKQTPPKHFLLKISGIWEIDTSYGITAKVVNGEPI